jgi:tRNA 2-selenouridine synthase
MYGKERISLWQAMARDGHLPLLVDELLVQHYDPAYLKSIERNFSQYTQAIKLDLPDISPAAFDAAARQLHPA